ncbi:MAG: hypothetical protein JSR48_12520 [Verrucomicrobia bacterium]|nr:hypothetical protein [Verrucomicrobiota bacterium]
MKTIDVSDEVFEALEGLAKGFNRSPDEVLAMLLRIPVGSPEATDPLAAFVLGPEFRVKEHDADRYLALLAWVAARHRAEFDEFIRGLSTGRKFLTMSREEILDRCRHNQARPIEGTPYWAILNLDTPTKRRFLARILEFVGYRAEVIEFVCGFIGPRRAAVATLI